MANGKCHLELYVNGAWTLAAEVRCDDAGGGVRSPTRIEYEGDGPEVSRVETLDTGEVVEVGARIARVVRSLGDVE
jgi:hypothetical protein